MNELFQTCRSLSFEIALGDANLELLYLNGTKIKDETTKENSNSTTSHVSGKCSGNQSYICVVFIYLYCSGKL